jgi:hypothetical protein
MASIEIKEIKKENYGLWDELVEKSPQGTIFHSSDWSSICAKLLNKKLKIYGCFKNGQLVAGCSFYTYKKGFFKIASSVIAATPYGGVILADPRTEDIRKQEKNISDIIRSLCNAFKNEHFDYIQLVNSPDFIDIRPFTWNGWKSDIHYTYYLDMNNFERNISKDARWTINKVIKSGITTEKSRDISLFYELFRETYMRQGLNPPVSEKFFRDIFNMLQNQNKGEMWIAKTKSGEVAAAEIIVYDNKRAYRWSAASHTGLRKTGATSLLLYEIFQDLKERGFKEINLMAANTPHLAKFIAQFNPKLVPYYGVEKKTVLAKIAETFFRKVER